ncbi:hypothetical protein ACA910_001901 [Epithemia clementina (nom. ined.)]
MEAAIMQTDQVQGGHVQVISQPMVSSLSILLQRISEMSDSETCHTDLDKQQPESESLPTSRPFLASSNNSNMNYFASPSPTLSPFTVVQEWSFLKWNVASYIWTILGGTIVLFVLCSITPGSLHGWTSRVLRWPVLVVIYILIWTELMMYIVIRLAIQVAEWDVFVPRNYGKLRRNMALATSYKEWYTHASNLDRMQGRHKWLDTYDDETARQFNWGFIQELMKNMQLARKQGNTIRAMAVVQQCTRANVGGILNSDLFSYSNTGEPKVIVKDLMKEVVETLHWITDKAMTVAPDDQLLHSEAKKREYEDKVQAAMRQEKGRIWKSLIGRVGRSKNSTSSRRISSDGAGERSLFPRNGSAVSDNSTTRSSDVTTETSIVSSNEEIATSNHSGSKRALRFGVARQESGKSTFTDRNCVTPVAKADSQHSSRSLCSPEVHGDQMMDFLKKARASYRRTALSLSGGAMMGNYHFGVIRGLFEAGILPRIIAGTSAGAVVGALVCTRTDQELVQLLHPKVVGSHITNQDDWESKISWFTNGDDMTFEEAYKKTGRVLCITLSPTSKKAPPVLANYLTCPNVTIASAVLASAAVPGFIDPVRLKYKDPSGVIQKYGERDQTYYDGSFEQDIPTSGLAEMLNCQFVIVSQCNPYIVPFFFNPKGGVGRPNRWSGDKQEHSWRGEFLLAALEMYLKVRTTPRMKYTPLRLTDMPTHNSLDLDFQIKPFQHHNNMRSKCVFLKDLDAAVGFTSKMMTQEFVGSTTIVPQVSFLDYFKLADNPTLMDVKRYFQGGEIAAYKHCKLIKLQFLVADALDNCISKLETKTTRPQGNRGPSHGRNNGQDQAKSTRRLSFGI